MKLLIGSQKFGYNLPDSDKDWMEFRYPSWSDIIAGKMERTEQILGDNTHIKVYDIRNISKIISDGHISSLQFMFSTEYRDCNDLKWFIDNRVRLCRTNMYRVFKSNSNNMIRDLNNKLDAKTLTRAYVFYRILTQLIDKANEDVSFYIPDSYDYRLKMMGLSDEEWKIERDRLITFYKYLETAYIPYKDAFDNRIFNKANSELTKLLKKQLMDSR